MFIHGYNTKYIDAISTAGQLAFDIAGEATDDLRSTSADAKAVYLTSLAFDWASFGETARFRH